MTSDERHEIAERLRDDDHGYSTEYDFFLHALGIEREGRGPCDWAKVHKRLADLIDPTCYPVPSDDRSISCSECGERIGAMLPPIGAVLPHYCQHCGARVKRGGER